MKFNGKFPIRPLEKRTSWQIKTMQNHARHDDILQRLLLSFLSKKLFLEPSLINFYSKQSIANRAILQLTLFSSAIVNGAEFKAQCIFTACGLLLKY